MKKQHGKIGAGMIALISIVSIIVIVGITVVASYVKYHDYAAGAENTVKAEYKNMESILAQYSLKIGEAIQVPGMQKEDLIAVISGANESRYGKGGSSSTMQWIKEQNPVLDQTTYLKIQQLIEAGRNKFENTQTKFIDTKRQYKTMQDKVWSGLWMSVAGYPKINLDDYKIISSGHAKKTFETGVDEGLKLR